MNSKPKHIGIVACSAEGAALCYRNICLEALKTMGEHNHPQITMSSIPMAEYMPYFNRNDMAGVAALMVRSARILATSGAAFAICPDNSCHLAFEYVQRDSPIPWLHIAEVVAARAREQRFKKIGILGTK